MDFVPWPHWFSVWPQFGLTNDGLLAGLLAGKMLWQKFGIVMQCCVEFWQEFRTVRQRSCLRPSCPFLPCPPERPLSLLECRLTSVPANSGTPYVLFSAKVMLQFSVNFSMTLLKIGHMGYL